MTSAAHPCLTPIDQLIHQQLAPMAGEIDRQGVFPYAFMQALGALGGFAAAIPQQWGGLGLGVQEQFDVIAHVGKACGSTAFTVWCQAASAWYLLRSPNQSVQEHYLHAVATGKQLCGTGMSNTVKHLAGIEKMHLKAQRQGDAYIINGILPWVSNIHPDQLIIVAAELDDNRYVMFVSSCNAEGLSLNTCPDFSGMEGSQTLNLRFHNVLINEYQVIAHPQQFCAYITDIKPVFVFTQAAMGLGVIESCLNTIEQSNRSHSHVNSFLDDQEPDLHDAYRALTQQAQQLASDIEQGRAAPIDILKLRAKTSELCLKAANSAVLHAGARGYLMRHAAQRNLREAVFVAIVTPALKHLRKEIHDLESRQAVQQAI